MLTILQRTNASTVILKGIEIAPTNKSATAKLANKMFNLVCISLFRFTVSVLTTMFRKMVMGHAVYIIAIAV